MNLKYSSEKNTLKLIAIMKHHGIKKVVISPGTQNICFAGSLQYDPYFELYSAPDERSAAYIACGLAAESGESVALSCTGATASRNYYPGLTEAFYRKLPVLAITATKHQAYVGQNIPQMLDRSIQPRDIVKKSVYIPTIENKDDDWGATIDINDAVLELKHNGCGPVHINLETTNSSDFSVSGLPDTRFIDRINIHNAFPKIQRGKKIAIFVGAHSPWSADLTAEVEKFCEMNNAVVLCDHTSNYHGKYKIIPALVTYQQQYHANCVDIDLLIEIGNISGAYFSLKPKEVWRVNPDGIVRDQFRALRYVYEMEEVDFFRICNKQISKDVSTNYYEMWKKEYEKLYQLIPDIPFSNIWVAEQLINTISENSIIHLGILNSLRSWNFYYTRKKIDFFCNTGGFGIDGPISTVLGGALARPDVIHYLIVGDLAFFYDMNALGNRHFPSNIRILLVNNGVGTEFKNYSHKAAQFEEDADAFMAARGHYGNKSPKLVRHLAEDLNFVYLTASDKDEFTNNINSFLTTNNNKPVIFEIFTDSEVESNALKTVRNLVSSVEGSTRTIVKQMIGNNNIKKIKQILKK